MRYWVGVLSAGGAGVLIGIGAGILMVEDKLKKEYAESSAAMRRAYESARINAETPVHTEEELDIDSNVTRLTRRDPEGTTLEGGEIEITVNVPETVVPEEITETINRYHRPLEETSPQIFASFAEIDEEEYYDETDGRMKEQMTMVYIDEQAHFFVDGEEVDDWDDRVGGSVVDEMRASVAKGVPTIYVRNNKFDTDYEIIFEQP